jgi:hypothetical protein
MRSGDRGPAGGALKSPTTAIGVAIAPEPGNSIRLVLAIQDPNAAGGLIYISIYYAIHELRRGESASRDNRFRGSSGDTPCFWLPETKSILKRHCTPQSAIGVKRGKVKTI